VKEFEDVSVGHEVQSPLRGLFLLTTSSPGAEAPGYYQLSLRDTRLDSSVTVAMLYVVLPHSGRRRL